MTRDVVRIRGVTEEGECTVSVVRNNWWGMLLCVSCQGEQHRISLRRRRIVLRDHDVMTETAQSVLAGRLSCECLALAWCIKYWGSGVEDRLDWGVQVYDLCQRHPARLVAEDLIGHFRLRGYRL